MSKIRGHININTDLTQVVGDKYYELSNLPTTFGIGNVLQVVTDRKLAIDNGEYDLETYTYTSVTPDGIIDYFTSDVVSQSDYYPFGMLLPGRHGSSEGYRYGFQGSEMDNEVRGSKGTSYTTEFRQYDPRVGRWLSVDPVIKQHESPYAWNTNNPITYNDVLGADSTQRANAVAKALEYVEQGTGTSASYKWGAKGGPGEPVDCSGLVSKCVVAVGESDPSTGSSNGVTNIANNTTEIAFNDIEVGSIVTFNNSKHTGIVSGDIIKDEDGNVTSFSVIQSASSTGPKEIKVQTDGSSSWSGGNNAYWSPLLGKAYKWDTKPDNTEAPILAKRTSEEVVSEARSASERVYNINVVGPPPTFLINDLYKERRNNDVELIPIKLPNLSPSINSPLIIPQ